MKQAMKGSTSEPEKVSRGHTHAKDFGRDNSTGGHGEAEGRDLKMGGSVDNLSHSLKGAMPNMGD
jgi:hypothetical protein